MDAGKRTISDIFNGNRLLVIPFFQRTYVWKEEQWERFVSDMEFISVTDKDYFLGSIILKQQSTSSDSSVGDVRTIIDGQQRITTMAIFLKVLGLKTGKDNTVMRLFTLDDDTIAIRHNHGDTEAFNKIMNLSELEDIDPGSSYILMAYNFFRRKVDPTKLDVQRVRNRAQFVGIDLLASEDEQQIFDTINSLGVRLTTGELLKNYFFSPETIEDYNNFWRPVFDNDDECRKYWNTVIISGRLPRTNIESFLSAFLQIKIQDPLLGISSEEKKVYRRSEGLFNNYKTFIEKYVIAGLSTENEKRIAIRDLVAEIVAYAKIYRENFDEKLLNVETPTKGCIERLNVAIYGLDISTVIPYAMFLLKNVSDEEEKESMFSFLEAYLLRRTICKTQNNNYSDLFTENLIGQDVRSFTRLKEYIESKDEESSLSMPSDSALRDGFHHSILPNRRAAVVLYLLESKIRPVNLHSTNLSGLNHYSLEHLMPKKWRNNWGIVSNPDDRDLILLGLGNLAIISSTLNSSVRDAAWCNKLSGIKAKGGLRAYAGGLETMTDVLSKNEWNEETIKQRADWLADKAISVWQ